MRPRGAIGPGGERRDPWPDLSRSPTQLRQEMDKCDLCGSTGRHAQRPAFMNLRGCLFCQTSDRIGDEPTLGERWSSWRIEEGRVSIAGFSVREERKRQRRATDYGLMKGTGR